MSRDTFKELCEISDEAWGLLLLERDAMKDQVPVHERIRIVREAISCGRREANLWKKNGFEIHSWLDNNNISVTHLSKEQKPPVVMIAEYTSRKKCITIYSDAIKRIANQGGPDAETIESITLAHECYHQIEEKYGEDRTFNYTIHFKTGPFRRKANLIQYSEIAANSFAKSVCNLAYWPSSVEVLLLGSYDPQSINRFVSRLRRFEE